MAGLNPGTRGESVRRPALPVASDVARLARANARTRLVFLSFVVLAAFVGFVMTRAGVERTTSSVFLGASADHYLDADGKAGIADITGALAGQFTPSDGTMVNRGTEGGVNSVLWLRFAIPPIAGDPARQWVLSYQETRAREVSLFVAEPGGAAVLLRDYIQGTVNPETSRAERFAQFTVEASAISGKDAYLRIYTRSSKRALLWLEPAEVFAASETTQMLVFGGIFGVMAALFFYLTSIGVVLRDRTFAALSVLVVFYCAYVASDRAFVETIFLPGNLTLSRIMSYVSTFLCYAAWLTFLMLYLRVGQYAPRVARFAGLVVLICIVFAAIGGVEVALNLTITRPYSAPFGILALVTGLLAAAWVLRFDLGRGIAFFVC
jgi:7TMR-DISM extracellular 2/7TM diverse intracellular signalling